jgi:hypothetical protein
LGPDAGAQGGKVIAQGTPEEVAQSKASRTAPYLKNAFFPVYKIFDSIDSSQQQPRPIRICMRIFYFCFSLLFFSDWFFQSNAKVI